MRTVWRKACKKSLLLATKALALAALTALTALPGLAQADASSAGEGFAGEATSTLSPVRMQSLANHCHAQLEQANRLQLGQGTQALLDNCGSTLAHLLEQISQRHTNLGVTQKKRLVRSGEQTLLLLRVHIAKIETLAAKQAPKELSLLAGATALENKLRLYLQKLHDKETWAMNARIGLGYVRWQDGTQDPLGGMGFSLLLDHGSQFNGGLTLEAVSTLKEESGLVTFPPTEVDIVAVNNAWLEFKRYRQVQFKLGLFPEDTGFAHPARWPFSSVQAKLTLFRKPFSAWLLHIRHDVLGVYSPGQNKPRASLIERNAPEMIWQASGPLSTMLVSAQAVYKLHWYTDPNDQLAGLSYGRRKYLTQPTARQGITYRVQDFSFAVRLEGEDDSEPQRLTGMELFVERWVNILMTSDNKGWLVGLKGQTPFFKTGLMYSEIGCASIPPMQLASSLFPGSRSLAWNAGADLPLGKGYTVSAWSRLARTVPLRHGQSCPAELAVQISSAVARIELGTALQYAFAEH